MQQKAILLLIFKALAIAKKYNPKLRRGFIPNSGAPVNR
jgi:hypothetical protein